MNLDYFKAQDKFYKGLQTLFHSLNIPVNYIDDKPLRSQDILSKTYKDTNPAYQLMSDVYILGMVDDKAFEGAKSTDISEIKKQEKDYEGILIFGVTLTGRKNDLLPTRTQLAEVTRAFNREFYYTPVVVIFRYDNYISLANVERQKYKQEWREGEKVGKVSILRDIEIENPHTGHLKILEELKIDRSGKKGINSFEGLYQYWQEVFSVNLLNKKFYSELSNWYFWAIKHVKFPAESQYVDEKNQQYRAQSVIRLLTRLLFVWFIKEKKLIPEELFNLEMLQKNILKKISPFNKDATLFKEGNKESIYYKAILQNLFFATLHCPIKPESQDTRERGFRGDESYGKHRGIDYLMRYKKYFKDPDAFLKMVNKVVPFLNGGLFECLDDKDKKIYIDGFSDNMSKTYGKINDLIVPDYLFFGNEGKTDLSADYGTKNKGAKEAAVKGLINILKSYKFTIAENTPIEEDVALDPELLGKVFENLLASYNPETKTTARKQTGSFYTPREIVNYMVDESLIAHLKNAVSNWDMDEKKLDEKLHQLVSFEPVNPFEHSARLSQDIIQSLDNCKILDPACGSGAFPMGILQKMVHILQKVDSDNEYWQELQLEKAEKATRGVFAIKDKEERKQLLDEINEAFDETINNPDYARKLFLIENCIYGVDIQPIAAQISKLRFFISLVVEQKVNKEKENFGIRPLPNLETKFVAANTLIGIDKPDGELFCTKEVQEKQAELKAIRHKLFGARTKATKVKYRKKDKELRNEITDILKKGNLPVESAELLAGWDPYDQNGVSPFFDPEWMFDVKDGFDIVIGNPPYVFARDSVAKGITQAAKDYFYANYSLAEYQVNLYPIFIEAGSRALTKQGVLCFITPNNWLTINTNRKLRRFVLTQSKVSILNFYARVFESADVDAAIVLFQNGDANSKAENVRLLEWTKAPELITDEIKSQLLSHTDAIINIAAFKSGETGDLMKKIEAKTRPLSAIANVKSGLVAYEVGKGKPAQTKRMKDERVYHSKTSQEGFSEYLVGRDVCRYFIGWSGEYIKYGKNLAAPRNNFALYSTPRILVRQIPSKPPYCIHACFISETIFNDRNSMNIINIAVEPQLVLGFLNSRLMSYWFVHKFGKMQRGIFPQFKVNELAIFPMPCSFDPHKAKLKTLVDTIMTTKKQNPEADTGALEQQIDKFVYELYELTDEEIAIVEGCK